MIPFADVPAWFAARAGANAVAITLNDETLTWGQLDERSTRRAHALQSLGVKPGDFVALCLPNGFEFFESSFAIWKAGASVVLIPSRPSEREARHLLQLSRPSVLIGGQAEWCQWGHWRHLPEGADTSSMPDTMLAMPIARFWAAIPSGGSTGTPKLIVQHMMAITGQNYRVPHGLKAGHVMLNPGSPLYHTAPFLFSHSALFCGGTIVLAPMFDAESVLQLVQKHAVNWLYLVPTMMHRIWHLPPEVREAYDLSSLETIVHTAAPTPLWLKRAWIDWLGPDRVVEGYGGTENFGGTFIEGREWIRHEGSVGRVDVEKVKIFDEAGNAVPTGQIGEINFLDEDALCPKSHCIGGNNRQSVLGWNSFGDFGYIDEDGYLFVADRREDLIVRGGVNIYPAEVESALLKNSDVLGCVVIGLSNADLGQSVHAIVQLRDGIGFNRFANSVHECLGDLAVHKRPATYELTNMPLRNTAGKVRRSLLRQERDAAAAAGAPVGRALSERDI